MAPPGAERYNIMVEGILKSALKVLPISALLLFSGCVLSETTTYCDCFKTVSFDFSLSDGGRFSDKVTSVEAGVFDYRGNFLRTERVKVACLAGMYMNLAPGDYRLVFWANMNGSTRLENNGVGDEWRVVLSEAMFDRDRRRVIGQADPLWFAPWEPGSRSTGEPLGYFPLRVTGAKEQRESVVFTQAYRTLDIYVEGTGGASTSVEIEGLPTGLHYSGLKCSPARATYVRTTVPVARDGKNYDAASFRTLHFDDTEGINIVLKDAVSSGEMFRTTLAEAISRAGINPEETDIDLVLSSMNGRVEISVPNWNKDKIDVN